MEKILIIDQQEVVFEGIKSLCKKSGYNYQLYWAADCKQALDLCGLYRFEMVISELDFESQDGMETLYTISTQFKTRYIIHSTQKNKFRMRWVKKCNYFMGFASKEKGLLDLKLNMLDLVDKEQVLSDVQSNLSLSIREEEVLKFILNGHNNKEISSKLSVSEKSVATYKHRMLKKLGMKNELEIFKYFMSSKVSIEDLSLN